MNAPITIDMVTPAKANVGDLESDERGSGARFNAGKTPYHLVPIKVMAETLLRSRPDSMPAKALFMLGCYQTTRDVSWLYAMVDELGAQEGWEECAEVFDFGRIKYAEWNWSKGMAWSVPFGCIVRHLLAMHEYGVADIDNDSKRPHRGHVFCNICMLVTFSKTYTEGDDFAPQGALA